jgi:hypothetical protein
VDSHSGFEGAIVMAKTILVIGGSDKTWHEVATAIDLVGSVRGKFDEIVAVNDAGYDYRDVDHWVTFHADRFEEWQRRRRAKGFPPVKTLWTSTYGRKESAYEKRLGRLGIKKIDYTGGGSSGLVATLVSLVYLRGTHVIIAGIPLDPHAGHYHTHGPWNEAVKHRAAWTVQLAGLILNVRSMSGWTAAVLGQPNREWLETELPCSSIELK